MENSYFYTNIEKNDFNAKFMDEAEAFANSKTLQTYLIDKPLSDKKFKYTYNKVSVVLIPKQKLTFVNFDQNRIEDFNEFIDEFIEDLSALSIKYDYREYIGRPRKWRESIISIITYDLSFDFSTFIEMTQIEDVENQRICELIISLLTGSINDIERIKSIIPNNLLDKIKQKIILFDGDQTRFIYDKADKHEVTIQGMSGTGKTELLLHKMKEVYVSNDTSKILFTCHNKILASSLRTRIPNFFNFMKVEQQIQWNERLLCVHDWGSSNDPFSGAFRYICHFYEIPFNTFSHTTPFKTYCQNAVEKIGIIKKSKKEDFKFAFDYSFIDESQDFDISFFNLLSIVTKSNVYIAGDIFQSIFSYNTNMSISPDHLLSKCYRTDPRTLMFAHALGMGLFEEKKLWWLEDNELFACGYKFNKKDSTYYLRREPLRRFEDLQNEDYRSIEFVSPNNTNIENTENLIIECLESIKKENPTVKPDDIGIIFLDSLKEFSSLADKLEFLIPRKLKWEVNKAYESKVKIENKVLISNKNNVKGLEFPFVICITTRIYPFKTHRNTLYTMLTRSFLKSILIITNELELKLYEQLKTGLDNIYSHGYIKVNEPTEEEKIRIKTTIQQKESQYSLYDVFHEICDENNIDKKHRDKLLQSYKTLYADQKDMGFDRDAIEDWINYNFGKMLLK